MDRAAQNGRRAIGLVTQYKRRDFATPVIFMRVEDGHLFVREGESGNQVTAEDSEPVAANNCEPTAADAAIHLAKEAIPIYKLVAEKFSLSEIGDICEAVGVDIENLGSPGKSGKARDLVGKVQRTGRLDALVNKIAEMRPDSVDELKGNLYVFMEGIKAREVTQLCQELKLDCQALKLDENGLLGYGANQYIRTERMQALQDHMVQNGRYAELVQAVKLKLPRTDFSTFER